MGVQPVVPIRVRASGEAAVHIFAITSPPSGVHIFAWPANFRNFAPKPCIFSHTTPVCRDNVSRVARKNDNEHAVHAFG